MQITDAQIHLWTGAGAPPYHHRAPYTIERALREMDEAGIDRAVNCPAIWDPDANDYAVEAAQAHPDRFATMGWFPLDASAGPHRVDEWMSKPGMLGLRFVLYAPEAGGILRSGALDWLWTRADELELPVALMVMPDHLSLIGDIAPRFPRMRLLLDHLAIGPFDTLPGAASHLDALVALAAYPNVAVKASGITGAATDGYPFASAHEVLRRTFDAFGPDRMFWGTDITRQTATWGECVSMFTDHLPWLAGADLERVMGAGISDWIGWH
ncbi:amidohydrolase family protein [Agromyces kandeliae]|uniref:Amidohydrolase family protein n=1 Tax=Agromyces kandeliae TaxID=2666141 RepID=A0A6L5R5A5_9MICO|nr:amidohydrolase family protein [Agromyces kandeliae]MRX45203.1 amidohydrolase family protein [Agromyces kandeliae]